ncbi:hypothetical protein ASE63_07965 [Bosea sp. Root381]|uniref:hypothetical protein n=1 Tax=Bosea sp. Root381 TaxID=1736524 RepID=UPI0006F7A8B7|nr:hypothetical protein [Bosea sp. Root381]KRE02285.1 hypothetical protein ASE63_07965 [Bosea sp. Root381]
MADWPILFSAPMVRALLDGRKTQTRRILKPQPGDDGKYHDLKSAYRALRIMRGDHLWVREAYRAELRFDWTKPRDLSVGVPIYYAADPDPRDSEPGCAGKLRPSMFMPRWASRLTLTVTDVRVQRVHDISEADAWSEGCRQGHADDVGGFFPAEEPDPSGIGYRGWDNARDWYADLWDAINGKDAWDANPWVAAYTFTVEQRNICEAVG